MSSFIDSLAYMFLTEADFQPVASAAGADWFKLPEIESVKIVRRYQALRATQGHTQCIHTLAPDLRYLDACELDLKLISYDESVLAFELNRELKKISYSNLAKKLLEKPETGDRLLAEFAPNLAAPVRAALVDQLIPYELKLHLERVKAGTAKTRITGFEMLSDVIGGFNPARVIMLMAQTGFGKTNLGLNLAIRAATDYIVGYINMEMIDADIVKRLVVIGAGASYRDYDQGNIDHGQVERLNKTVQDRLYMTDGRALSLSSIQAWARLRAKEGMKLLIVDYDQKIELHLDRMTPEWKAVQKAIASLEELSKEIGVCIIVFAQVNRDGEVSSSHRATFSASTVLAFEDHPEHGPSIIARKNRHGVQDQGVAVDYEKPTSRIREKQIHVFNRTEKQNDANKKSVQKRPEGAAWKPYPA